ncbi:MAG: TIGR03790 family protein [Acidobacteriaceae bacterium]|nr:TIGR03790 family protein [Acidobacteriaceae bacterium]
MPALVFAFTAAAQAPPAERVLVVYNAGAPESKAVASYYAAKRNIPAANLCKIEVSSPDQINQAEYDRAVKGPVQKCLDRAGKDKILYIVFSYKTPWLLEMPPPQETYALDQFIADPWDEYLPERAANQGEIQPYFGKAESEGDIYEAYVPLADYRQQPSSKRIYSVWRLDAASAETAKGMVDKALYAEAHGLSGNACFDRRTDPTTSVPDFAYGAGDWDIHQAAELARRAGFPVTEDAHAEEFGTAPAPARCDHAALYTGWYSLNHYNDAFSWNPGAIGIHLDSASATNPRGGTNWAAGAIARGITVTAGATTEPYLDNLPHPDQMLWYLFHGANVGDALLRSERLLKWRIINVGDPLYRPFPKSAEMDERMKPKILFALLPQIMLDDSSVAGAVAVSERAASGGETFAVRSEHPDIVGVPATVTIPEGTDAVKFPIRTFHVSADGTTVRVYVKGKNLEKSNTLIVFSLLERLAISPGEAKGGSKAVGTVAFRRPAAAGDAAIALKSSNAAAIVPVEIKIPNGQTRAVFPIDLQTVSAKTVVTISATYAGMVRTVSLTVTP